MRKIVGGLSGSEDVVVVGEEMLGLKALLIWLVSGHGWGECEILIAL